MCVFMGVPCALAGLSCSDRAHAGPEFGGAIGIIFFAANAVGIAFYMQGFSDTLASDTVLGLDPDLEKTRWQKFAMAVACLLFETVVAIVGSGAYAKFAVLVFVLQMTAVGAGCLSILTNTKLIDESYPSNPWPGVDLEGHAVNFTFEGISSYRLGRNLWPQYSEGNSYAVIFKTIFPAMTGMMAGANMSGVLKRPEIAIPSGELWAVFISTLIYIAVAVLLGASVPRDTLKNQYLILSDVTWFPQIVTVGIVSSTSAQAFASIQVCLARSPGLQSKPCTFVARL